jgi:molybdopterin converting factor small subunit
MTVRVLFFGATASTVGLRETSIDLGGNSSLSAVLDLVLREHPSLGSHKLLFSVNQEYAGPDTAIHDGDEIAVFTPVSGG